MGKKRGEVDRKRDESEIKCQKTGQYGIGRVSSLFIFHQHSKECKPPFFAWFSYRAPRPLDISSSTSHGNEREGNAKNDSACPIPYRTKRAGGRSGDMAREPCPHPDPLPTGEGTAYAQMLLVPFHTEPKGKGRGAGSREREGGRRKVEGGKGKRGIIPCACLRVLIMYRGTIAL